MRRLPVRAKSSQFVPRESESYLMSSPVFGWNTIQAESAKDPRFARLLENWFPDNGDVNQRSGSASWTTAVTKTIRTLMTYSGPTVEKMFGANNDGIYDFTASGAIGATVSAATDGYWKYINFANGAGSWLIAVNGVDNSRLYDGTIWLAIDALSTPAITGVATTSLIDVTIFKHRVWFVEKNSMNSWYLGTDAIAGAATKFEVGQIFRLGGKLLTMAVWTIDGGNGTDDLLVFYTSKGELAVYKGTDPASPTTFGLVGVYFIGAPVGRRPVTEYGGDLLFLTRDGLFPLSTSLQNNKINRQKSLSRNINSAYLLAVSLYGEAEGWEMAIYPEQSALVINIPAARGIQYVMNTNTGAWCSFAGWHSTCWGKFNHLLYFGFTTGVALAYTGISDFGAEIVTRAQPAFTGLGHTNLVKHMNLLQPKFIVAGSLNYLRVGINVDYEDNLPDFALLGTLIFGTEASSFWNVAVWDVSVWGGGEGVFKPWLDPGGLEGKKIGLRLETSGFMGRLSWLETDFIFTTGSIFS